IGGERADSIARGVVPGLWRGSERRLRLCTGPLHASSLKLLCRFPVSVLLGYFGPYRGDDVPLRFQSGPWAVGKGIDELRRHRVHQPAPGGAPSCWNVEDAQGLHGGQSTTPPALSAGESPGGE